MKSKTPTVGSALCILWALWICSHTAVYSAIWEQSGLGQIAAKPLQCLGEFATHVEADAFLRTAKIIESKNISVGVSGSRKITLEKDGRQAGAIFKHINQRKPGITPLRTGPELDFKDSWQFEIAAYELDKLLKLNMIPPTVERVHEGKHGSLQLWINGCMTEEERINKNISPPDPTDWGGQIMKQRLFDNLIYNIDRNSGNILISANWGMILIDHSRAFKSIGNLRTGNNLTFFSRSLVEALGNLDEKAIKRNVGKYLTGSEIHTMLQRRSRIMDLYRKVADDAGALYP